MVDIWVKRERDTQQLVGACADHLLKQGQMTGEQLHGLCALTWITVDQRNKLVSPAYMYSTKLPALQSMFGDAVNIDTPEQAADDLARLLKNPKVKPWVKGDTAFTNFYPSYRNSCEHWLHTHRKQLQAIISKARTLKTDAQARALAAEVRALPRIPKANQATSPIRPEFLLTPLLFALDPRHRFPVINGRVAIQEHLRACGVFNEPLERQFDEMVRLIGPDGYKDSAELDVAMNGETELETVSAPGMKPTVRSLSTPLTHKPTDGKDLNSKDAGDVEAILKGQVIQKKRLHNEMTNRLRALFEPRFKCDEGQQKDVLFDVIVRGYNELKGADRDHLLIEVKSISDEPNVRMAIGQLYAYGFCLNREEVYTSAILLPTPPNQRIKDLLEFLDIGCMWFESESLKTLHTETPWLEDFVACQGQNA